MSHLTAGGALVVQNECTIINLQLREMNKQLTNNQINSKE